MRKLVIAHCSRLTRTETFIRAHVEKLPFETTFIHDQPPQAIDLMNYQGGDGKVVDALEDFTIQYRNLLREHSPQVVLAEYGPSGVAILEACKEEGIPLVVHFHGFDISMSKVVEHYLSRYTQLFKYASRIIAVSKEMGDSLIALGAKKEKLSVVPYGVDLDRFTPTPITKEANLLFVGRLVPKKSPLTLLKAFSDLLEVHPEASLTIAGDGPLLDQCKKYIEENKLRDKAFLLGATPNEKIPELLAKATVLVLPSTTAPDGDKEGLPNCILEAMACGRPVIATAHAGIPTAVIHEETGLLVEEGDPAPLTKAITRLLSDYELASRLGETGRAHAEKKFSQTQSIEELGRILLEAAS